MLGNMMSRPLLIQSILEHAARVFPDTEVVSRTAAGGLHRYTYSAALRRSSQLAHALAELGLRPGDRVGTLAWNDFRHFELYYAVPGSEAVCYTVNPRLAPSQIEYIIRHANDRFLFVDPSFAEVVERILPQCPAVEQVVMLCDAATMPETKLPGVRDYESFIAMHPESFAWPEFDENTASALCYTSGTTGDPKGVLYSHRSCILHALVSSHSFAFGISSKETVMPVVPMFHVNAWNLPYSAPLTGAKLVLPGPAPTGTVALELIKQEQVSIVVGVPTVSQMIIDSAVANESDLAPLRAAITGGSTPPPKLIRDYESRGVDLRHGSGMTETSSMLTMNRLSEAEQALPLDERVRLKAKQGQPPFGLEMRIVDDAGELLPWDGATFGELQVRSPWTLQRYFQSEHLSPEDAWLKTGDVATIDQNARMQIVDRSKDVIKSGGEWISSIDLENEAASVPGIALVAAVAIEHAKWGERPLLVVEPRPGFVTSKEAVLAAIAARFPKWWCPDDAVFVERMPLTATGKVSKLELRKRFKNHYAAKASD